MNSLKDKVIAVTGAGSGMGREIALLCARRGAIVSLADFDTKTLKETMKMVEDAGGRGSAFTVDVSKREQVRKYAQETRKKFGRVDIVFNNAGVLSPFQRFENTDYKIYERVFSINFYGVLYGSYEFIPFLLENPGSALVNTASAASMISYMGLAPYVSSKFAVRGLTETLRMEYTGSGLQVVVVIPGAVATNISKGLPAQPGNSEPDKQGSSKGSWKAMPASQAAQIIVNGVMAGKVRILVGSDAKMQDLMGRFFPVKYTGMIYKKMKELLPDSKPKGTPEAKKTSKPAAPKPATRGKKTSAKPVKKAVKKPAKPAKKATPKKGKK